MHENNGNTVGVVLFAKPPIPGIAKTRLSLELGDKRAMEVYRGLLTNTVTAIGETSASRKLVYSTHASILQPVAGANVHVVRQDPAGATLAEKVNEAVQDTLSFTDRVIIVVADDILMNRYRLQRAIDLVCRRDVLVGPTIDGGLYLIGLSRRASAVSRDLPFGKSHLSKTLIRRSLRAGVSIEVLEEHIDIDCAKSLTVAGG